MERDVSQIAPRKARLPGTSRETKLREHREISYNEGVGRLRAQDTRPDQQVARDFLRFNHYEVS